MNEGKLALGAMVAAGVVNSEHWVKIIAAAWPAVIYTAYMAWKWNRERKK